MTKTQKLLPFEVIRTPKLRDSVGKYVKSGELCQLTKDMAEHYHKLGYIRVTMGSLFNDTDEAGKANDADNSSADGANEGSDDAEDGDGPDDAEPDLTSGETDKDPSGQDDQADTRVSAAETSSRRLANTRRKRAAG